MSSTHAVALQYLDRVWRSRFARNVAMVVSGSAGAQAITMAFAPLITRIYGPEAYGLLGTFMAIVAIAIPVAALAYPIAIVLPKADRDALGLVRLSTILSCAIPALAGGVIWAGADWFAKILEGESVGGYLYLIPLGMVFAAWLQIAQQWLVRKKEFGILARAAVAHSVILNSAKAGIGWMHPVGAVLIVLATLGQLLHAALLVIGARKSYAGCAPDGQEGSATSLKELATRHRDFPIYRAPESFINAASQSLPVLMLVTFFGPTSAGFYSLGRMVLGTPATLIGKSVGHVFYPRIVEAFNRKENLTVLIVKATVVLAVAAFLPLVVVLTFGPWLFGFVFGAEWVMAGEYARWLALWLFFGFINKPAVMSIPVLNAQRFHLAFSCLTITIRALALGMGYYLLNSDLVAVALFGVAGALLNLLLILIVLTLSHRYDQQTLNPSPV